MAIEGLEINVYQFFGLIIAFIAAIVSPLVAFAIKQKSRLEKLETLRENDRKDFDEHMKHSELQSELLNRISESVSVFKYMLERIERDIADIKSRNSNSDVFKRSAV